MGIGTALLTGMLNASSTSATIPTAILAGHSSQTANLLTLANSSGSFLSGFTASGGLQMNIASSTAINAQAPGGAYTFFSLNTLGNYATSTLNTGLTVATSTLVVNASEGRVGIGTASPTSTLQVLGTA